jgi:hypothetical protein
MNMIKLPMTTALFLGALVAAPSAKAVPITYTETATATGTLDGTAFTDALVTITVVGDTSGATSCGTNCTLNTGSTNSVSVSGRTDSFTGSIVAFANANINASLFLPDAGIADASVSNLQILGTNSTAFATYVISNAIGPTTGVATGNPGQAFPTLGGDLVLTDVLNGFETNGQTTFTATTSQTPLPAALPLFATGLGLIAVAGWRRKRKAQASRRLFST